MYVQDDLTIEHLYAVHVELIFRACKRKTVITSDIPDPRVNLSLFTTLNCLGILKKQLLNIVRCGYLCIMYKHVVQFR